MASKVKGYKKDGYPTYKTCAKEMLETAVESLDSLEKLEIVGGLDSLESDIDLSMFDADPKRTQKMEIVQKALAQGIPLKACLLGLEVTITPITPFYQAPGEGPDLSGDREPRRPLLPLGGEAMSATIIS